MALDSDWDVWDSELSGDLMHSITVVPVAVLELDKDLDLPALSVVRTSQ